jgi:hypothetical protein
MGIVIIILMVIAVAQLSIVYTTASVKFDTGQQAWTTTAYMNTADTTEAKVTFSTLAMQEASDNTLKPKDSETINIKVTDKKCVYSVTKILTVANNGIYKVYNPSSNIKLLISSTTYPKTAELDIKQSSTQTIVNEVNGGVITAASTGFSTEGYCYIGDNMRVLKLGTGYIVYDGDKVVPNLYALAGLSFDYLNKIQDINFYNAMTNTYFDGSSFTAVPKTANAKFAVTLTADKEYFSAEPIVTQNPVGKPNIIEMTCPDLQTGRKGTTTVIVKNIGESADVELKVNGQKVTPTPTLQSKFIFGGEQKTYSLILNPSEVSSTSSYTLTAIASSTAQLSGNTDTETCTGSIEKASILIPSVTDYCGNKKCSSNENPTNCPEDCAYEVCDYEKKFEVLDKDTNKCVCLEGYDRNEADICTKSISSELIIAGIVLGMFIIIALVIAFTQRKRRR